MFHRDLVSVIITNYNYEMYIAEAIESVLNQTYKNYEIIIVDDGSNDNSLQIIHEYKRQYPNLIKTIEQENSGQATAFNNAFEMASGKIIALLDADDYWYPNKLETIVNYHRQYPAIQHNLNINNKEKMTILDDKIQKQQYAWENYAFTGFIPTSALSFVKSSLEFVFPIQDNGYKVCADWYLKSMYLNEHDIFSLNESLGCYRAHGSNSWYLNPDKYAGYGDFILEQANLYRKQKNKKLINSSTKDKFKKYLFSTLNLNKSDQYILFGTGQLGRFFYQQLRENYKVIGFTNSMTKDDFEFEGLICKPMKEVIQSLTWRDKIIIATESLGEVEYLLKQLGVEEKQIVSPKL